MLQKFRASLEEAEVIKDRNLALDFIGKRGSIENAGRVRVGGGMGDGMVVLEKE
jgi:hypothetical protein